ncbi:MAG: Mov34/MPN/PAD-1 family protein [Candidatus Bathyarchaeia archaeon]|jgi:proteasome lid subunit RPN8/RPN11|nr:peptidase [Candidatus Bathyarchaeota archaeon A05DMB-4]MDH7594535.1 Mov34/MPN/PAD-1 family protein [Candidatus Bathyarchaeota archaeon]
MTTSVQIKQEILEAILKNAASLHPREMMLLLRGKTKKDQITITDLIVPPFATHGKGFASFQPHMLPMDFSIVGMVHSHPSGIAKPSLQDLHHSFGRIIMIVAYPYQSDQNVSVFDRSGEKLVLKVT